MPQPISWQEILGRKDLEGGEVELQDYGTVYRGPLKEIQIHENEVTLSAQWLARRDPITDEWRKAALNQIGTTTNTKPILYETGMIVIQLPLSGTCVLYPKTHPKLEYSSIEGLEEKDIPKFV